MASRNIMIGTSAALTGLAGLAAAAVTIGAPNASTTTKPAAATVETQTQVVSTVEHRTKRLKAHKSHDGRTVIRHAAPAAATPVAAVATTQQPAQAIAPTVAAPAPQSGGADDSPGHDAADDHGAGTEPGDDNGGDSSADTEPGDDNGGDSSGQGSGHGGDDQSGSNDD
jgi:hypothetical protein